MTHEDIVKKLLEIRSGAIWTLNGDTYDGLVWSDTIQVKPTAQEIGL
jgi:hypothetical protein